MPRLRSHDVTRYVSRVVVSAMRKTWQATSLPLLRALLRRLLLALGGVTVPELLDSLWRIARQPSGHQLFQLGEDRRIHPVEVEAALALHAPLEFGRHAAQQLGVSVHREEMEAGIAFPRAPAAPPEGAPAKCSLRHNHLIIRR